MTRRTPRVLESAKGGRPPRMAVPDTARDVFRVMQGRSERDWRFNEIVNAVLQIRGNISTSRQVESVRTARGLKWLVMHRVVVRRTATASAPDGRPRYRVAPHLSGLLMSDAGTPKGRAGEWAKRGLAPTR